MPSFSLSQLTIYAAHSPGQSTETAITKVVNDLFFSLHKEYITILILLDFSSVFDIIAHSIPMNRFHTLFEFRDIVHQRFSSYHTD